MGKRGGKRGGHRGRGGGGPPRPRPDNRVNKQDISRYNDKFEHYYNSLGIVPNDDRDDFWEAMRRDLPNSFRFTGSRVHALAVQERLRAHYIPEITSITYEGQFVEAPKPVEWYPDQLAWFMTTPKNVVRRFKPFANFQKFLVAETDVGNITRQEVVSMIPPLLMDLKPGMSVLDLCAAPGSKSAQLIEMLHAGEEERQRRVAESVTNGEPRPQGEEYEDEGRATGLLIANDVDYKRAHMLVHQMKRLASPNIIVTNHDATVFPSIKIPSLPAPAGKQPQNRYLKFDRILSDVPCSGDGTVRKNMEIWKSWNPGNALGLHATQVRILVRALQMLKVGGRVVYSTCSMNPVEDEAVLAEAISRVGGSELVEIIETKDSLPGLQRYPGLRSWSVMDKMGRIWDDYESVLKHKEEIGEEGLGRLSEGMFPPKADLPLDRAIRVYPHLQDTGAFFIAILEKKAEIKAQAQGFATAIGNEKAQVPDSNGSISKVGIDSNGTAVASSGIEDNEADPSLLKRKRDSLEEEPASTKKVKGSEDPNLVLPPGNDIEPTMANGHAVATSNEISQARPSQDLSRNRKPKRDQPFEEPFKYLSPDIPELDQIRDFYNLSTRFPSDRYMVRNAEGTASKKIYYTCSLAKDILRENEGKGLKFVHAGVIMYVKQDAPAADVCPWRIQTDGLRLLETWVGQERIVRLRRKETLRKLLIEMFPRFTGDELETLGEVGQQILNKKMGCCVLIVEPSDEEDGFNERMVFPLWKSLQSVNLMLPKEDRKAMLLRLFNDDTPLINLSKGWIGKKPGNDKEGNGENAHAAAKDEEEADEAAVEVRRNSSSPEPMAEDRDDEEGGVSLSG